MNLPEIRARLAAATPGPWVAELRARPREETVHYAIRTAEPIPEHPWSARFIAWMTGALARAPTARLQQLVEDDCIRPDPQARADAELIAHAPTDLAELVAEVDRLASENTELRAVLLELVSPYPCDYNAAGRCVQHLPAPIGQCPQDAARTLLGLDQEVSPWNGA